MVFSQGIKWCHNPPSRRPLSNGNLDTFYLGFFLHICSHEVLKGKPSRTKERRKIRRKKMGKLGDKWMRSTDSMLRTWSPQLALQENQKATRFASRRPGSYSNEITLQASDDGTQTGRLVGISLGSCWSPRCRFLCDGQWPSHTQRENSRVSFQWGKAEGLRNIRLSTVEDGGPFLEIGLYVCKLTY